MNQTYESLESLIENQNSKNEVYRPTSFWKKATMDIKESIGNIGLENFRKSEVALSYFVPNYGPPANSFDYKTKDEMVNLISVTGTKKQNLSFNEFITGYSHALSDYRVFIASDDKDKKPYLEGFSESDIGNPIEQFSFDGKKYSRSALNYILGLCFLKKHLTIHDEIKTVMEIGGGFGSLGEILSYTKGIKYIDIDIPPMSFITDFYLRGAIKGRSIEKFEIDRNDKIKIKDLKDISVLNSWDIENLCGDIDLFVNFISFQEMEPDVVENYLNNVLRLNPKFVLLRNMREGKEVKNLESDFGVEKPMLTNDYIEMIKSKYKLLDSNVYPFGYKTVDGFHSELLLFKKRYE